MEKGESVKTSDKDTSLKSDFSYSGYEDWKEAAISSLKGKDFTKSLLTHTYEGITLDPIYTEKDLKGLNIDSLPGKVNFLRGQTSRGNLGAGWDVCQRMGSGISGEFNKELSSELRSGQNTIFISTDKATSAGIDPEDSSEGKVGVNGLSLVVKKDINDSLNNIDITKYPVVFDSNVSGMELLMLLNAYMKSEGIYTDKIEGAINFDPLGVLSETGELDSPPEHYYRKMALMIKWVEEKGVNMRIAGVSALSYHNAGASAVQELAIALSTGVEYIDAMSRYDISPSEFAGKTSFRFGIGSDFFMEIAKLRAGRVLWNRILKEYGVIEESRDFFIHAETSMFNQSGLDPYVNMLRITTEAFSAIAGGAERLTTNPFDRVLNDPSPFSRRVARNVQMVLREESHLHRMIDPSGGSYFVEKLTSDMVGKVWEFFLEIEKEGGVQKALESGFLRKRIGEGREKLEMSIAKRKKILVGTNNFGNPDEQFEQKESADQRTLFSQRVNDIKEYKDCKKVERDRIDQSKLDDPFEKRNPKVIDDGTEMFINGATIGEITSLLKGDSEPFMINGNTPEILRLPEKMEKLRKRVYRLKGAPELTIAVSEPFLKIKPRGDFSKSFFETGGFNSTMIKLEGSSDDKVKQILGQGNQLIVLCAADEDYPELVSAIVPVMKRENKSLSIVLAGDPGEKKMQYLEDGVDFFIHRGSDLPGIISGILNISGVDNG